MDTLVKALVFNKNVLVSAFSTLDIVKEAKRMHNLSLTATAALGRALSIGAFMAMELKGDKEKLSITIDGGGKLGKIIVCGDSAGNVKGVIDNPTLELPISESGKLSVGEGIGSDGFITVIKNLGLKEPYVAKSELVSGEIAEDFTAYFLKSEQRPSAVALGVGFNAEDVNSAGGIVVQLMPDCPDHIITVVEDIITNFNNISSLLSSMTPYEIIDYYFGHFEIEYLKARHPRYKCDCSIERSDKLIISLGKDECMDIINNAEDNTIQLKCEFCNNTYVYDKNYIDKLFGSHL